MVKIFYQYNNYPNYPVDRKDSNKKNFVFESCFNDTGKNKPAKKVSIQKIARANDLRKIRADNNINSSENSKDSYYNYQQYQYYKYCNTCKLKNNKPLI